MPFAPYIAALMIALPLAVHLRRGGPLALFCWTLLGYTAIGLALITMPIRFSSASGRIYNDTYYVVFSGHQMLTLALLLTLPLLTLLGLTRARALQSRRGFILAFWLIHIGTLATLTAAPILLGFIAMPLRYTEPAVFTWLDTLTKITALIALAGLLLFAALAIRSIRRRYHGIKTG